MNVTFSPSINFEARTKLKITKTKPSQKLYYQIEEIWNGRVFNTIKEKKTNKLVQTALLYDDRKPFIVTNFKDGLPSRRIVFNEKDEIILHRKYDNGIAKPLRVVNDDGSLGAYIENDIEDVTLV